MSVRCTEGQPIVTEFSTLSYTTQDDDGDDVVVGDIGDGFSVPDNATEF